MWSETSEGRGGRNTPLLFPLISGMETGSGAGLENVVLQAMRSNPRRNTAGPALLTFLLCDKTLVSFGITTGPDEHTNR